MPEVGQLAPSFALPSSSGGTARLAQFAGQWLVLYFYPKDMTSGCTAQACALRDAYQDLGRLGAEVVGISRDKVPRHHKFIDKERLPFVLLTDEDAAVATAYDAFAEKSLYGRKYWGIVRSTFLIDPAGVIRAAWRNVKVPGHVDAVLQELRVLQGAPTPHVAAPTKKKRVGK